MENVEKEAVEHEHAEEPVDDQQPENVRTEYKEVCQSHRAVTDFRGKLLTALPLVSGVGIYALISKTEPGKLTPAYFIASGIFGVLVTVGLFLHELRGIGECGDLIQVGGLLEKRMGFKDGQFIRTHKYYHEGTREHRRRNNFVGPIGAGWIIYSAVCMAWLFVAVLGVCMWYGFHGLVEPSEPPQQHQSSGATA